MANLKEAELKLYIYEGDFDGVDQANPQYTLKKSKLTNESTILFEVSELIKDYIEIEFDGNYDNLKQSKWVQWTIKRTYDDDSEDTYSQRALAFRGYGNIEDGINPELSKDKLFSNTVINNFCGRPITAPFYQGDEGTTQIIYKQDTTTLLSLEGTSSIDYTVDKNTNINPVLNLVTVDKTQSKVADPNATANINEIPLDANSINYKLRDGTIRTVEIRCIDECKNTPHKISFINKFGVMQDIWFFARKKDSISSDRQKYKKTILSTTGSNTIYDISSHQQVYLENQGRESFIMDTGYIHESYNEVIKELIVSEFVYIHDESRLSPTNSSYNLAIPVTVASTSVGFKENKYEKLINYQIEFQVDSEFIQSVR
jgi:hypothetical protein